VLSNARRHAPGERTHLVLDFQPGVAALRARTPPSDLPAGTGGAGRGLAGLRDRAEAAGGEASWRLADDGFVVDLRVPR
jgi:signal transduction histidine kinase